jgi:dipeptidyl aminopeptidase/acylaminoacyl peptidase
MKHKWQVLLLVLVIVFLGLSLPGLAGEQKRAVTVDDMHSFKSVENPVVSPDGKKIAFTVSCYPSARGAYMLRKSVCVGFYSPQGECASIMTSSQGKKKKFSDIYIMDIDGKNMRKLTAHPAVEKGISWGPDSRKIAFSADREGENSQIYIIDITGGEAEKRTDISSGASDPQWSPDGKWIAFYSPVGQLYSEEFKKELGDVRYITRLRYYHVKTWDDGKRKRIFVVPSDGKGKPVQLTSGECADEGDHSMTWSPDSKEIAFVSNRDPEWWNSINTDVYTVSVPEGKIKQITTNRGPDHSPAYSPDGKYIAFRSIFTYNYESENYKVVAAKRDGQLAGKVLTGKLDRSIRRFKWGPDSKKIYFLYGSHGVYNIKAVPVQGGEFQDTMVGRYVIRGWDVTPGGKTFIVLKGDDVNQNELYSYRNKWKKLTAFNDPIMKQFYTQPVEEIWVQSEDDAKIQAWIIKPVGFEKGKKYPMILSIHGGPHGMSSIGYRFYFQLLAANGYVVVYSNPRASLGYGEKFSRQIWEEWGGLCYRDLMRVTDAVLELGFVDEKQMGVTGGSFGGYMTNWIVGQNQRFAAAVTSAGLSNLTSFYGTTDEQFFPETEFKGAPWENSKIYVKHSPIWYAKNFKTPTMVIHGQNDFRVRTEQAEQMFTALQKQKVPSVYVWFPNEGHGVRKPVHRKLYYKMILDWFDHFLKGKSSHFLEMAAQKGENE